MDLESIEYIASSIGNLLGIPVRIYAGKEKIFYHSTLSFPSDPIEASQERILEGKGHISYYVDSFFYYYGVVSSPPYAFVIGPSRQMTPSKREIREYAFFQNVENNAVEDFIALMSGLPALPLSSMLQILCALNFILNDGERVSPKDIQICEPRQSSLIEEFERQNTEETLSRIEDSPAIQHNTYDIEQTVMGYIAKGEVELLKDYFSKIPAARGGLTSNDIRRQMANIFIVTATLASRSAIQAGVDVEEALSLSDAYIQMCDLEKDIDGITNLQYRMIIDYAERVERLKYGDAPSKLASEVLKYVRAHLSEPITTEKIAKSLYLSRSYLSSKFKEEVGENLSSFIADIKIGEAKRLLRYTDKPLSTIALYLGFSSQSHFARVFKAKIALTPKEYRDRYKK